MDHNCEYREQIAYEDHRHQIKKKEDNTLDFAKPNNIDLDRIVCNPTKRSLFCYSMTSHLSKRSI